MSYFIRCMIGIAVAAQMLTISGCALVEPRLSPDPSISKAYEDTPNLPNAVNLAQSLKAQYEAKVETHIYWERVAGLTLIGAAAIATDLAIRSVGSSAIIGLGVGAGAIYAGSNWLNSKPQLFIYAAGASALQCAMDAVQPLRLAYVRRDDLERLIKKIEVSRMNLEAQLMAFTDSERPVEVLRARAAVQKEKNVVPVAREALGVLDGSAGELRSSVSSIQTQVTNAVAANSPSLQALVESLGKSLPSMGARIVGVSLPSVPDKGGATKSAGTQGQLVKPTVDLENDIVEVEAIIATVRAKPAEEKLKNCNVDLRQAGLAMKVLASGDIIVQAGGTPTLFSVSGGVLPYRQPVWTGQQPPSDQVTVKIETGLGLVSIEAKKDAPAGGYVLDLFDSAQGRASVAVVIKGADPAKKVATADTTAQAKCTSDPAIVKVQQGLLARKIEKVKVGGVEKSLTADGCMGPITEAAMRQFYKSQTTVDGKPIADDAIPKDPKQLLKEITDLLNV
jgi:hypothetical protein